MASPLGHAVIGMGLAALVLQIEGTTPSSVFWLGAIVASNLPDIDLVGLLLGLPFHRIHRQATHSLLVLAGLLLAAYLVQSVLQWLVPPVYFLAWAIASLSHPLLDVITTGPTDASAGFGIPLFWPLSAQRWAVRRPIFRSAPIRAYRSIKTLSVAILPELYWCTAFAAVLVAISYVIRR